MTPVTASEATGFNPRETTLIRDDPRVLERFYLAHYDEVLRYLARRLDDPHDVADLVAETFLAAIDAAGSFDHRRGRVTPWLIGIAHNHLRHFFREHANGRNALRRAVGRRLLDQDDIAELVERIDAEADGARAWARSASSRRSNAS